MLSELNIYNTNLSELSPHDKLLINTINAHSYNVALKDNAFKQCLINGEVLIPDGVGITLATLLLKGKFIKKIAGADLFYYEMERLQKIGVKCFFMGSTPMVLKKIIDRGAIEYPNVSIETYSPPYKDKFSDEENKAIIEAINAFKPDVLFVGMTAPKQEKWAYEHLSSIDAKHICCIGAVFDFYAGTVKRAPRWMIKTGMEWLYRFIKEPKRMWRRYLIGNMLFIWNVIRYEVIGKSK